MRNLSKQSQKCLSLSEEAFNLVESRLAQVDATTVREYIFDHNEWGLGMDILVEILLEQNIAINIEQKQAIIVAMDEMNLENSQNDIRVSDK